MSDQKPVSHEDAEERVLTKEERIEILLRRIDYLERENNLLRFEVRQKEIQVYGSNH